MTPGPGPPPAARIAAAYIAPAIIVVVDAATKQAALAMLFAPARAIEVLPFLNLVPVWNPGISFGLLGGGGEAARWLLAAFAVAVGVFLPYHARHWGRWSRAGAQMMAGGAIGNAVDRTAYGRVVDFVDLHAGGWHWPAFNVADMAITVGAGLILAATMGNTFRVGSTREGGDR